MAINMLRRMAQEERWLMPGALRRRAPVRAGAGWPPLVPCSRPHVSGPLVCCLGQWGPLSTRLQGAHGPTTSTSSSSRGVPDRPTWINRCLALPPPRPRSFTSPHPSSHHQSSRAQTTDRFSQPTVASTATTAYLALAPLGASCLPSVLDPPSPTLGSSAAPPSSPPSSAPALWGSRHSSG